MTLISTLFLAFGLLGLLGIGFQLFGKFLLRRAARKSAHI